MMLFLRYFLTLVITILSLFMPFQMTEPTLSSVEETGAFPMTASRWTQDYQALAATQPEPLYMAESFTRYGGAGVDTHLYEAFVGPFDAMLRVYTEPYGEVIRHISVFTQAEPVERVQIELDPMARSSVFFDLEAIEGSEPTITPEPSPTPEPTPVPTRAETEERFLALALICIRTSMPWLDEDALSDYENAMREAFAGEGEQTILLDGGIQCIAGVSTWHDKNLSLLIVPAPDMTFDVRPTYYAWQTATYGATSNRGGGALGWNDPVHSATDTSKGRRLINTLVGGRTFVTSYVETNYPFYLKGFEVNTRSSGTPEEMRAAVDVDLNLFAELTARAGHSEAMLDRIAEAVGTCLEQVDAETFDAFSLDLETEMAHLLLDADMSTTREGDPYLRVTLEFWYK